jgi:prophage antirepressor-like protein
MDENKDKLVLFEGKKIRRILHEGEWHFSVVDVVEILTESPNPRQYWRKVKDREFAQLELYPIWVQLKIPAEDGKLRETDCSNTKNTLRIIQSIPSKRQNRSNNGWHRWDMNGYRKLRTRNSHRSG